MSKVLYVNGDSFPAGAELTVFKTPVFKGYLAEVGSNLQYQHEYNTYIGRLPEEEKLRDGLECKALAWPAKLASRLGLPLVDDTAGAVGMFSMALTTVASLETLLAQGKKPIAFLSELSPDRFSQWFNDEEFRFYPSGIVGPMSGKDPKTYFDIAARNRTDRQYIREYSYHKMAIVNYCNSRDIPLYWIDSIWLPARQQFKQVDSFWAEFGSTDVLASMIDLVKPFEKVYCPNGHFSVEIHDRLVEDILKKLDLRQLGL